jgi:hypothetical protein
MFNNKDQKELGRVKVQINYNLIFQKARPI